MRTSLLSLLALGVVACNASATLSEAPPTEVTVAVTSPAPGAELIASEHPTIKVAGTVTSNAAQDALEAWVNGVRVDVVDGAFSTELTPEVGINHLKIEGGNDLGDLATQELDVVWAADYLPPAAGETRFDLAGALELRLGQRFFDARLLGTTLDLSTDPVVARDVGAAVELILRQIDLKALISGPLFPTGGPLDLSITSVTPASIVTDVRIIETPQTGLELKISLLGVALGMQGHFTFDRVYTINGSLTADLHAQAGLTLSTAADGSIAVGLTSLTASLGPLTPDFQGSDGAALDSFITLGQSNLRPLIEGLLTSQLIPTFTDRVPPLLTSLLGSADQLLDNLQFTLDIGVGKPVTLQLDGRMDALDIGSGPTTGHVTVREDLTVGTSGTPIHASSRGAPRLDASTDEPTFSTAGVHLAVRLDFLNALLHALWNAGMLEGQLMIGNLAANLSARLPPVIRPTPVTSPCKIDGERCDVQLQLGQLQVEIPAFQQSFGINASAGARVQIHGGTVSLLIEKVPELTVWETSATPGSFSADTVRDLIASAVWPQLFGAIGDNLTFALPLPDLAALGLGDLAPGLASAQLVLQPRQRPSMTAGRLVLGADLALSTPPPPPP
ncbi:MAG TPA: hypothetical protein VFK02_26360 [Kofleriaceae bacterium]|nr:hypothetical protein [Kofleriaceae bacterium]